MSCFCYLHIFPNEKLYVGTTQREKVELRWGSNGYRYKKNKHLYSAIQKYGWENVKHQVIVCETPEEMWAMEIELIKKYDTTNPEHGYNHSTGGENSTHGCVGYYKNKHLSPEHRKKISESLKGRTIPEEVRKKISEFAKTRTGEKNPFYKHTHTEEVKRKISETKKNTPKPKWFTPDGEIKIMDKSNAGKHHPDWKEVKDD